MKVYEALAEALVEEGMETLFAVSGYGNLDLVVELAERKRVRLVTARHEQGAVAMADGQARVTGRPGFCTVTQGPGLTNTATALTTAVRRRSPVVLFAGDAPVANRHDIQLLDQRAFVEALGSAFFPVRTEATVAEDVALALRHVLLGLGPAVVDAHVDVQGRDLPGELTYIPATTTVARAQRVSPDPVVIDEARSLIGESTRIIIVAGIGAVRSDARDELTALAEELDAVIATTIQAKDYFRGHPRAIGVAGGFATDEGEVLFGEADCVLAFGASMNVWTTKHAHLFPSARLIHVDLVPAQIGDVIPADVAIVGDASATASALLECIRDAGSDRERASWFKHAEELLAAREVSEQRTYSDGLDPRAVVERLNGILPENRTLAVDGGHFLPFATIGLDVPEPSALVFSQDFGAVGLGLPLGIGAAIGVPDRHCVTVVGDGGFMMSVGELETAVRARVPLTVVILNDGAYGGEVRQLEAKGKPLTSVLFENPNFAEVARALGAEAVSVNSLDDLDAARRIDGREVPLVLDVKISREVTHKFVEEFTTRAPWEA
jgi:acetolactate synthase I/II/III large subunit